MSFEDWDGGAVEGELAEMYDEWKEEREQHAANIQRLRRHGEWAMRAWRVARAYRKTLSKLWARAQVALSMASRKPKQGELL